MPQLLSLAIAQSAAARWPGDAVSRGPPTSVRKNKCSITFPFWKASA